MASKWPLGMRIAFRTLVPLQKLNLWSAGTRRLLLRASGVQISKSAIVRSGVDFTIGDIAIGDHAFINQRCLIDGAGGIKIGDRARLACDVRLITSTHEIGAPQQRAGPLVEHPITIGSGCWIGANVTVLPNVVIGAGALIGAASLVNRSIEHPALYAGIPARLIRDL